MFSFFSSVEAIDFGYKYYYYCNSETWSDGKIMVRMRVKSAPVCAAILSSFFSPLDFVQFSDYFFFSPLILSTTAPTYQKPTQAFGVPGPRGEGSSSEIAVG